MRDVSIQRTTTAILRDAFRVDTQVPNAPTPESDTPTEPPRLPHWLYGEKTQATAFSPYDLRKMTEGARL